MSNKLTLGVVGTLFLGVATILVLWSGSRIDKTLDDESAGGSVAISADQHQVETLADSQEQPETAITSGSSSGLEEVSEARMDEEASRSVLADGHRDSSREPALLSNPGDAVSGSREDEDVSNSSGFPAVAVDGDGLASETGTVSVESTQAGVKDPFEAQRVKIDRELQNAEGYSREDLLAMYGRSSAAAGRFDLSAAAYTVFLEEFGEDHPYSARIAMRLADSLAPINYDATDIEFTSSGPVYSPYYRTQYTASREHLVAAVAAYGLAARLSGNTEQAGSALIRAAWVERALGDWKASTEILDHCVSTYPASSSANKALKLCSENLRWTGHTTEALQRLQVLADRLGEGESRAYVLREVEELRYEARRGEKWDSNPTSALAEEIESREGKCTPFEVYRSVRLWLRRRCDRDSVLRVSRWAFSQADWPKEQRVDCGVDLVDALVAIEHPSDLERDEAIATLGVLAGLAEKELAPNFALRQVLLMREADRLDEATDVLDSIFPVAEDSPMWEPLVLCAKIDCCLEAGDRDAAQTALAVLRERYPGASRVKEYDEVLEVSTQKGTE